MMNVKATSILLLIGAISSCVSFEVSGPQPVNPEVVYSDNELAKSLESFAFNWEVLPEDSAVNGYQILVSSDLDLLSKDIGDIWDSGRRYSKESTAPYKGGGINKGQNLWWKMRLWQEEEIPGYFTKPQKMSVSAGSPSNRVVLVGGSLIAMMEKNAFLEMTLTTRYPERGLSFRNVGWPADDVFGLARSQFGSAQNTQSWQPPSAEEGFGSKVLKEHLIAAAPNTLIIGYGGELAYGDDEAMELFRSGYSRLLDLADSLASHVLLLSPHKHEDQLVREGRIGEINERLGQVRDFISSQAMEREFIFVDLFEELIEDPQKREFTENGVQLNERGYRKMSALIARSFGIDNDGKIAVEFRPNGEIVSVDNAAVTHWKRTVRGIAFDLEPNVGSAYGELAINGPHALYVDGEYISKGEGNIKLSLASDSIRLRELHEAIIEKNKMNRYRLQPLNEAYIYLFRRHEMGHLAYEMDEFAKLVAEGEERIARLSKPISHRIEIELIKPWSPPKDYPEDEVPAFVPEPDISNELQAFTVSEGFEVNLFASDPMIANPIGISWDTKGRAWVATSSTYPHIVPGREPNDKIVILEDRDKDGVADTSMIFAEHLLVPHSVMPVEGGAYVTSTTEFLFLADTNGDDRADSRRVVYGGFGNADVHHMIHGLRWSPWGDLYFTQSIYINSFVETPYGVRVLNGSGTWQFRPETERLDVFNRGLINPWGFAFDAFGQSFETDGAGSSGINYTYPESAHATAVGAARVVQGLNSGTPKNTGSEVVYSRQMPSDWQGSILTNDFRANRTVRYEVTPLGSGYTSKEVETVLHSDHRSYRPVDIKVGPDGAIYIVDWYNPIIDHGEVDFHHPIRDKSHGRIWRLTNKNRPILKVPQIHGASMGQLLDLLKVPEQNIRLLANRELVAQRCSPQQLKAWVNSLRSSEPNFHQSRLEVLWLGAALNYLDDGLLMSLLQSRDYKTRAAAVRMVSHWNVQGDKMAQLTSMVKDAHPQVRLEVIHALREYGTLNAVNLALEAMDLEMDENLEFALWTTSKSLKHVWLPELQAGREVFGGDINKQMYALLACDDTSVIPTVQQLVGRDELRPDLKKSAWQLLAKLGDKESLTMSLAEAEANLDNQILVALVRAPESNKAVPQNLDLLGKLLDVENESIRMQAMALVGRWKASGYEGDLLKVMEDVEVNPNARLVAARSLVKLGALGKVKQLAISENATSVRSTAMAIWIESEPEEALEESLDLLNDQIEGEDAERLFLTYRKLEKGPAILTEGLLKRSLPEDVASIGLKVSQTSGLDLRELEKAIRKAGAIKPIGAEMTHAEKRALVEEALSEGDRSRGRSIYRRPQILCGSCHRVDGIGGLIGPDLSSIGSYMTPNSILESILNPNSDIKQGYETVIINKKDGEVLSGTLYRKTDMTTLVRIASGEIISIPSEEIAKVDVSPVSLMPAGLTANLHRDELRDLLTFLSSLGK